MSMAAARVAIVTGAARGIGRAISLRLARDGHNIVANDVPARQQDLEKLVNDIRGIGKTRSVAVTGDISKESDVQNLVKTTVGEFGSLDVMVANAGIALLGPITTTSVDDWEKTQSVNSRGVFLSYREAAIQMIKQGRGGRIIGASSNAGKQGVKYCSAYSASKFAVRGLTQSTAAELWKHGITVNAYAPGMVKTPMLAEADLEDREGSTTLKDIFGSWPAMEPDDIAALVSYLAKDDSRFITGQTVSINGGVFFD